MDLERYSHTLEEVLSLSEIEKDVFEASTFYEVFKNRVYGGNIVSQAVKAASLTLPEDKNFVLNSVHSYFISGVKPTSKVMYHIKQKKDGQTFNYRHVVALQNEKIVFSCSVSFQLLDSTEVDLLYNQYCKPDIPGPKDPSNVPSEKLRNSIFFSNTDKHFPLEIRVYSPPPWDFSEWNNSSVGVQRTPLEPKLSFWMKPKEPIVSNNQNLNRIAFVYESDVAMTGGILRLYPEFLYSMAISLDICMWFHNDVDVNQWHLFDIQCLVSSKNGTSIYISRIFCEDGIHVATAIQQGYIRKSKL